MKLRYNKESGLIKVNETLLLDSVSKAFQLERCIVKFTSKLKTTHYNDHFSATRTSENSYYFVVEAFNLNALIQESFYTDTPSTNSLQKFSIYIKENKRPGTIVAFPNSRPVFFKSK